MFRVNLSPVWQQGYCGCPSGMDNLEAWLRAGSDSFPQRQGENSRELWEFCEFLEFQKKP